MVNWLIICWILPVISCATLQDAENLLQTLKNRSEYDRHITPLLDQSQTLEVNITLAVSASDIEFIEVENKVKIRADVVTEWKDETLHWNSSDYGNLDQLQIQGDWIWRPSTLIRIPMKDSKMDQTLEGDSEELEMILNRDGRIFRQASLNLFLFCSIDTTNFPFDKQSFSFTLSMSTLGPNLKYSNMSACTYIEHDNGNPKWTNLQVSYELVYEGSDLMCIVSMKRKPLFFVINIILPVVFLGYLEVLVFVIPADAGEKLSYAVALLLSYSVFISFVSDNIPEDSDNVSDMFHYIIIQFFLGSLIIFCTTLQLRLYHRDDEKDIPVLYKKIVKFVNILMCRSQVCAGSKIESSTEEHQGDALPVQAKQAPAKYKKTTRVMRRSKTRKNLAVVGDRSVTSDTVGAGVVKLTWHNVSSAIDFMLFWVFMVAQIVLNLWFFYPAYRA
ncbi:neuronal acetylcholine receptor subunit beta-3-like [Ostrea edulis]|uniref:neuronal acetylcholine receptor subunit beta-3-like n=1 Tax=Ostrea edulis TaxID=37623 RepID=UPI0024AF2B1D|nr:neuronal acetylcholine receptor subunit beta-3-like [Ostrea edulis]